MQLSDCLHSNLWLWSDTDFITKQSSRKIYIMQLSDLYSKYFHRTLTKEKPSSSCIEIKEMKQTF